MNKKAFLFGFMLVFTALLSSFAYAVDVSIDRAKVNGKALAESKTNFLEESNELDVQVALTAIKDLSNIHVEAVLTNPKTGNTIADSSGTFILKTNQSTLVALNLKLIDVVKKQTDCNLGIRVIELDGDKEQNTYGIRFTDGVSGATGRELDVSIDGVELEGDALAENENNFVIIDKSEKELGLRVRLTALENVQDAHVDAVLAFENGDVVADATTTFDINDGENLVRELELPLSVKFEQSKFKLKVKVTDAEGDFEEKAYGLKISRKKFPIVITSIQLSPESSAEAGKANIAKVSFRNIGVLPLDGIIAKVSIPELGISVSKFVGSSDAKNGAVKDFVLDIPEDAGSGTYTIKADISSQFGNEAESKQMQVFIVSKTEQPRQIVNDKLVVNVPVLKQDLKNDGSEVIYPLILTNQGPGANTYTLALESSEMIKLRLSESNVFVIKPRESKTINIYASSTTKAAGEHIFVATIKSNDKVLAQIPFRANIVAVRGLLAAKLKDALQVILIGAVILVVAIAVFLGINRYTRKDYMRKDVSDEIPDEEKGEAYY